MVTQHQVNQLNGKLKNYKQRYLRKQYQALDESGTRLMVNYFLTEVLGYTELDEIKTEYQIRGEYADYVIQLQRKKHFVVEVKSIEIDLTDKHLRQSLSYAANEGVDWILLFNGRQVQLYKVNFGKPVTTKLIYAVDLMSPDDFKKSASQLVYLTKQSVARGELDDYWRRFNALAPENLCKLVYSEEVAKLVRKELKSLTGIYFQIDDVADSLYEVISKQVEFGRPKLRPASKK
ncbi:type I restriction enzyme HsdR N-terminal domain-containing protein [Candidatus Microgenomates bacterium]|nr:type I restriction enzyme HsdR N-terminal domain-containing protein [Candidatus Microgenomates bacterium]